MRITMNLFRCIPVTHAQGSKEVARGTIYFRQEASFETRLPLTQKRTGVPKPRGHQPSPGGPESDVGTPALKIKNFKNKKPVLQPRPGPSKDPSVHKAATFQPQFPR